MPAVRAQSAVVRTASRALAQRQCHQQQRCSFSATTKRPSSSGSHEQKYENPTGWLWGLKPGEKYQKEGWETPFFYGFCGSLLIAAVAYAYKPDTSIQTWALEEARRRLEAEGILEDPNSSNKKA